MSAPDWDALAKEATGLLQRYIRIDTSNPPGNEALACDFLEPILAAEGIGWRRYTSAPGRDILIADLPASDPDAKPLVLLNHTDVVPVERAHWSVDPFAGLIKDGYLWGRGALDMKGMGILELIAVLNLKRRGVKLRRPVRFFAVADEEAGSTYGAEFLAEHHPEALDAEFVINEGGWGTTETMGVKRPVFNCAVSEKGPCWLRLSTEGRPGHGSVPHANNALNRLVRALNRILEWQRPRSVVPELAEYFARAHKAGFLPDAPTDDVIARMAETNPLINAITTNTISLTTARAGVKHNVIPATAEATIDCRLLPGTDAQAFIEDVRRVIDDPEVRIEPVLVSGTPPSPFDSELMAAIDSVVHEHIEDAVILPSVSAGFTDSRVFRRNGTTSYGFIPFLLEPAEAITIHGHNERVSIENIRLGCQMLFEIVQKIAT